MLAIQNIELIPFLPLSTAASVIKFIEDLYNSANTLITMKDQNLNKVFKIPWSQNIYTKENHHSNKHSLELAEVPKEHNLGASYDILM